MQNAISTVDVRFTRKLSSPFWELLCAGLPRLAKSAKEFANGNSLTDSKSLGVLEETAGEVCYVVTLQKVKTSAGAPVTMLGLIAVTNAHDNLLFLYQYTLYADAASMLTALANLKIVYSEFAAANKK
jgi:hypothetical protein